MARTGQPATRQVAVVQRAVTILGELADARTELGTNEIARRTGIKHESPQAIVFKDGEPVYHASHYDITIEDLKEHLSEPPA